jgi:NAD(P)-dependent dehydrogenase (short-subunit alcohol dehydrogenase family)
MANLFDLTGKNAMIIGGAGGLGQLIAKAYAGAGAKVAIASRNEEKLKAACEELKAATVRNSSIMCAMQLWRPMWRPALRSQMKTLAT